MSCRSQSHIAICVAILFVSVSRFADADPPQADSEQASLQTATTEELIDQFAGISQAGVGFHPTAWASGFVAVDGQPRFEGGVLGSTQPAVHPAMKEVVRRGVDALPLLISHLDDDRKTKLTASAGGFIGVGRHSDEYHSRGPQSPPGVNTDKEETLKQKYALRVGDLCYVAIGQIVNRNLHALRYQPTRCYVINSPVKTPALARAVKRDWTQLTVDAHRKSLVRDAEAGALHMPPAAVERLCFYYPQTGEAVAVRLLSRTLYDNDAVWDFIRKQLVKQRSSDTWKPSIAAFRAEHGAAIAETIPYWLHWIYRETDYERSETFLRDRAVADKILQHVYPQYRVDEPPLFRVAEFYDQVPIVRAVRHLPSAKIDQLAHQLYLDAPSGNAFVMDVEKLAVLNARRLRKTALRSEYIPFFERRIAEMVAARAKLRDEPGLERYYQAKLAEYRDILAGLK